MAATPSRSGEATGFLRWSAAHAPRATGFRPAQSVANALGGGPAIDLAPWSPRRRCSARQLGSGGLRRVWATDQLPLRMPGAPSAWPATVLAAGSVDALCEQLVAGPNAVGDVQVVCGSTLIIWVATEPAGAAVCGRSPTLTRKSLSVGPATPAACGSTGSIGSSPQPTRPGPPGHVPVWWPYVRGERIPYHDPARRGAADDLDLTQGPAQIRRGALEASARPCAITRPPPG